MSSARPDLDFLRQLKAQRLPQLLQANVAQADSAAGTIPDAPQFETLRAARDRLPRLIEATRRQAPVTETTAAPAADDTPSIGLRDRFIAQLTADPQARVAFLQSRFGDDNVTVDATTGRTLIRTPNGVRQLDPAGLDLGDIVDIPGELAETGAALLGRLGGTVAAAPLGPVAPAAGIAAGAAASGAVRGALEKGFQALADVPSPAGKAATETALTSAIFDSAFSGLGAAFRGVANYIKTGRTATAKALNSAFKTLRSSVDKVASSPALAPSGAAKAGKDAADGVRRSLASYRQALAEGPGKQIERALVNAGDLSVNVDNVLQAVRSAAGEEGAEIAGSPAFRRSLDMLEKQIIAQSSIQDGAAAMPLRTLQRLYSRLSAASVGKKRLAGLPDDAATRNIASQLANSVQDAIEGQIQASPGSLDAQLLRSYREARQAYKAAAEELRSLDTGLVRSIFRLDKNQAFENIPNAILSSSTTPSQVANVARILNASNPTSLANLQSLTLRRLAESAQKVAGAEPERLARSLRASNDKLIELFGTSASHKKSLEELARLSSRIAEVSGESVAMPEILKSVGWIGRNIAGPKAVAFSEFIERSSAALANAKATQAMVSALKFGVAGKPIPAALARKIATQSAAAVTRDQLRE